MHTTTKCQIRRCRQSIIYPRFKLVKTVKQPDTRGPELTTKTRIQFAFLLPVRSKFVLVMADLKRHKEPLLCTSPVNDSTV